MRESEMTGTRLGGYGGLMGQAERFAAAMKRDRAADPILNRLLRSVSHARKNAASRSRRFTLTPGSVYKLYLRSGGRCMVSGVPFSLDRYGSNRAPFAPSIDRIDSGREYDQDNVRLVCQLVNLAMNVWGDAVFARFMASAVEVRQWRSAPGSQDGSQPVSTF